MGHAAIGEGNATSRSHSIDSLVDQRGGLDGNCCRVWVDGPDAAIRHTVADGADAFCRSAVYLRPIASDPHVVGSVCCTGFGSCGRHVVAFGQDA